MANHVRDLISIVHAQLPVGLRDKLSVDVESDPYHLRVKAKFKDQQHRTWEVSLIEEMFEGVPLRCKVPDEFIAQLCAAV